MNFLEILESHVPFDAKEAEDKKLVFDFYANHSGDIFTRDNEEGHMCASCWVVNPAHTKVLMAHHNIYKSLAWLGGHADGDEDLARVAAKELAEESGLEKFHLLDPKPFMVLMLQVAEHIKRDKLVKAHLHPVFVYLFEADDGDIVRPREGENTSVEWVPVDKIDKAVSESDAEMKPVYRRLMKKLNGKK